MMIGWKRRISTEIMEYGLIAGCCSSLIAFIDGRWTIYHVSGATCCSSRDLSQVQTFTVPLTSLTHVTRTWSPLRALYRNQTYGVVHSLHSTSVVRIDQSVLWVCLCVRSITFGLNILHIQVKVTVKDRGHWVEVFIWLLWMQSVDLIVKVKFGKNRFRRSVSRWRGVAEECAALCRVPSNLC